LIRKEGTLGSRSIRHRSRHQRAQEHHRDQQHHGVAACDSRQDDENWPAPDKIGKQDLDIRLGNKEIFFRTAQIGSYLDVQQSKDPEGLKTFYYLVQDLKCFVFALIGLHFRVGARVTRSSQLINFAQLTDDSS